jgi:hypothetical protein
MIGQTLGHYRIGRNSVWVHPLLKKSQTAGFTWPSIHSYISHRIANLQVFCLGRPNIEPR